MREAEFDALLAKSSLGTPAARRARSNARLSDVAAVYNKLAGWTDELDADAGRDYLTGSTRRFTQTKSSPDCAAAVAEVSKRINDLLVRLHSHGVVHRDLKPDNILVLCEPHAKELDLDTEDEPEAKPGAAAQLELMRELWIDRWKTSTVAATHSTYIVVVNSCSAAADAACEGAEDPHEAMLGLEAQSAG